MFAKRNTLVNYPWLELTPKRPKALPTSSNAAQLQQNLKTWQSKLSSAQKVAPPAPAPLNVKATGITGGIKLTWGQIPNGLSVDGYQILRSPSGTFANDLTVISITDSRQTQYTDQIPSPTQVSYIIRATSGTTQTPHSVLGAKAAAVSATSA